MAESGVDMGFDALLADSLLNDTSMMMDVQYYEIKSQPISGTRYVR